jgi:hypothetical protein
MLLRPTLVRRFEANAFGPATSEVLSDSEADPARVIERLIATESHLLDPDEQDLLARTFVNLM